MTSSTHDDRVRGLKPRRTKFPSRSARVTSSTLMATTSTGRESKKVSIALSACDLVDVFYLVALEDCEGVVSIALSACDLVDRLMESPALRGFLLFPSRSARVTSSTGNSVYRLSSREEVRFHRAQRV